ncbi:mitochondrial ribosomal protein L23 [Amylocystis lapponica]|nr:mitochondrial ribosomal protein L23 [Amylocystis lapponica]
MHPTLRRLFAVLPDAAEAARTASTPRAVRLRRSRKFPSTGGGARPSGLTATEYARYQRDLAKGDLLEEDGTNPTEGEWLERLNSRRTRMRGVREVVNAEGEREARVVGQKVYLPNIIFRLVRNHTPPGQPYNPYEATFRIPQSVTKTDVRAYLLAVYGVATTYIRTDNYNSPVYRTARNRFATLARRTYKRAVVGLVDPFYYPLMVDDMNGPERAAREKWLNDNFNVKVYADMRKQELMRSTKGGAEKLWGWGWRTKVNGTPTSQRGNIMRLIAQRRAAREQAVVEAKDRIREGRQTQSEENIV